MKAFSIFTSILIYFISFYFIIGSFSIEYQEARTFPQVIGVILVILTTIYLTKNLGEKRGLKGDIKRVIGVGVLAILYVIFTPVVGYFITTPIIIFLIMLYLRMKDMRILVLNPLISTLLIYLVFVKFFKIPVP